MQSRSDCEYPDRGNIANPDRGRETNPDREERSELTDRGVSKSAAIANTPTRANAHNIAKKPA